MFKFSSTNIEPALNSVSNRIELKRAVQINQILAIDPRVSDNNQEIVIATNNGLLIGEISNLTENFVKRRFLSFEVKANLLQDMEVI